MNSLTPLSILLTLGVAVAWGFNFIMVKVGLDQIPPLTLCTLRFLLAALPAIFFIPKPNAPWKYIIGYGLITFALQFSLLFAGMAAGVSAGIAALILQLQVFFAIFFAYFFANQKVNLWQVLGAIICFLGIGIIAMHRSGQCTLLGFLLILSAAIAWGAGNLISIRLRSVNMLSLVIWSSFVAFFPMALITFWLETPEQLLLHPGQLTLVSILAVLYITYVSTHFGYGAWSWLVSKYPVASIAPFALLCPILALIFSSWLLHESFEPWKFMAAFLVMAGLCINVFGAKVVRTLRDISDRKHRVQQS